jgi:Ca-activated chloride channel family protein
MPATYLTEDGLPPAGRPKSHAHKVSAQERSTVVRYIRMMRRIFVVVVSIGAFACGHALENRAEQASPGVTVPVVSAEPAPSRSPSAPASAPAAASPKASPAAPHANVRREAALAELSAHDSYDSYARSSASRSLSNVPAIGMLGVPPVFNTEQYAAIEEEGFVSVSDRPLSTFSIDVDTASYSNVRRFLTQGSLPPAGAVRIEELINYFSYDYPEPGGSDPFGVTTELGSAPWKPEHKLLLVGLRGRSLEAKNVPPRNLVFLIDVSGSMADESKLPLVKSALAELAKQLRREDHVSIVVYAGASGCVLEPTPGSDARAIEEALQNLEAGGGTNGAGGIQLAYELARKHFDRQAINRVILATDGDFNVGTTSESELVSLIERERESGVFLTVLGVGTGNLKDSTMEKLADHGNGNYAYLDTPAEARRVLVEAASGTLVTIAKDVKIQVEFNPSRVKAYRLIGYENRRLQAKDFNDDKKDAGEIGAGHSVTALYEIVPVGVEGPAPSTDALKYQQPGKPTDAAGGTEVVTVKLRYKQPDGDTSKEMSVAAEDGGMPIEQASANLRFAAAVATFGMVIGGSEERGTASYDMAQSLARDALGGDPNAYRAEFLRLIAIARSLG